MSLPFYEDPRLLDRLEDQLQPHSEENQVKAKKSANLQDQFRRIDPKSSIDKIHKDLVDALQRASRITKLFESRIRQEFPGNKKRPLVTKTRVPRTQISWKIDQSIEQIKTEFLQEAEFFYKEVRLPIIKSRGYI
ncbi:unnamed protein product [Aphanomyces euteiches]